MPLLYHDEPIWRDGKRVGRITSGMYGHTLGGAVGLGYVDLGAPSAAEDFLAGRYRDRSGGAHGPRDCLTAPALRPCVAARSLVRGKQRCRSEARGRNGGGQRHVL